MQMLVDRFGWQRYAHKHYESRFTRFYEGYWLPTKFGYDKRRAHFSSLILTEQMTRDEALRQIASRRTTRRRSRRTSSTSPPSSTSPSTSCAGYLDGPEQELPRLQAQHGRDHARAPGCCGCSACRRAHHPMITIVDYGLGNILAFLNVYKRLNIRGQRPPRAPTTWRARSKLILPGVGAFDHAMDAARRSRACARRSTTLVLRQQVPGARRLRRHADPRRGSSDEGTLPGLGWIDGAVQGARRSLAATSCPLPHMGWNDVAAGRADAAVRPASSRTRGSTSCIPTTSHCDRREDVARGGRLRRATSRAPCSAGNIYGVQFHPEKSHHYGARLLKNFAEL